MKGARRKAGDRKINLEIRSLGVRGKLFSERKLLQNTARKGFYPFRQKMQLRERPGWWQW